MVWGEAKIRRLRSSAVAIIIILHFHYFHSWLGDHRQGPKKTETEKVHIFYNLFTKSAGDEKHVMGIVEQQFALVDPALHEPNVMITSIGHRLPLADASLGNASYHIIQHHEEGNEYLTLHRLWEFCKSNPHNDTKVVYLHSKGSYHPSPDNDRLRHFLTQGALSSECANLPQSCDVCSSRMSPLPHPHTPGNMWLARCDYVSKLINPVVPKEGKLADVLTHDDVCKGRGRFFSEHWIHSHPSVKPCDLHSGKEFVWAYRNVPAELSGKDLQIAPRFNFDDYIIVYDGCPNETEHFIATREEQYKLLYNITRLSGEWWGWKLLERTFRTDVALYNWKGIFMGEKLRKWYGNWYYVH
mmetsp:Transcript_46180/g.97017  ORF Transcript_46180/g.97017 Transcript_46180/m.97017 type:complete len:356 (-) Transcript_46180:284-1351(-)